MWQPNQPNWHGKLVFCMDSLIKVSVGDGIAVLGGKLVKNCRVWNKAVGGGNLLKN